MKLLCRLAPAACCLMIASVDGACAYAQGHTTAEKLAAAVDEMSQWLETTPHAQGWHRYLKTEELRAQLAAGDAADRQVVAGILSQYQSGVRGLDDRRFAKVRQHLEQWAAELARLRQEEIPAAARQAAQMPPQVTDDQLRQARAELRARVVALQAMLDRSATGAGWKRFLHWEQLTPQLRDGAPADPAVLATVLERLRSGFAGLERPEYVHTAEALERYVALLRMGQDADFAAQYARVLQQLADDTAALSDRADTAALTRVSQNVAWLQERQLVPEIVEAVQRYYWRPNLLVEFAAPVVVAGFNNDNVQQTGPVEDVILGTRIRGTATTQGKIVARLVPDDQRAMIWSVFSGVTQSHTTGYNQGATIVSRGTTRFEAIKAIAITPEGFRDYPATADAITRSTPISVSAGQGGSYGDSIAWQRVRESLPRSNAAASQRAAQRLREQLDAKARERLAELNASFEKKYREPLLRRGAFPSVLRFSTTDEVLRIAAVAARAGEIPAPTAPPPLPQRPDVLVQVHETMIANFYRAMYAAQTVNQTEFAQQWENSFGELPEGLQLKPGQEPWEITFDAAEPVSVVLADDTVTITVRGTSFRTLGNEPQNLPMNITAVYRVEPGGSGLKLQRQGDLVVLPPDYREGQVLDARQTTLRRRLMRQFADVFQEELLAEGLKLPGRWEHLGVLPLQQLSARDGWLTLGWVLPASVAE
jgi:hypothetical protein